MKKLFIVDSRLKEWSLRFLLSFAIIFLALSPNNLHAVDIPATFILGENNNIDFIAPGDQTGVSISLSFGFSGDTDTLSVLIDNNSSTEYAPGVNGFGFDVTGENLNNFAWNLVADDNLGNEVIVGTSQPITGETYFWTLNSPGGVSGAGGTLEFDYYPYTIQDKDGSFYNPDLTEVPLPAGASLLPGGQNTNFFTTATLELIFDDATAIISSVDRAFARLQNVGAGGDDSLKLVTDEGTNGGGGGGGDPVPEPGTLLLLGFGLLGISGATRRKRIGK